MRGPLALFYAGVAGVLLLAAPQPVAAGPTTCPSDGVCIDESVEGATPTITAPSGFQSSVVPVSGAVGEEWLVIIGAPFTSDALVQITALGLLEPGSPALSDAIDNLNAFITLNPNFAIMTFDLFSDNELGQIGTTC